MRSGNSIIALHEALGQARLVHLPPIRTPRQQYITLDKPDPLTNSRVKRVTLEGEFDERRPYEEELSIVMFPQLWGSTSLGFGGIGGASMTTAYTVIVQGPTGESAVYFGGTFAYLIKRPGQKFAEDLMERNMNAVRGAHARYELKEDPAPQK